MKRILPFIFCGVVLAIASGEIFAGTAGLYVGGGRAVIYADDGIYRCQVNTSSASGVSNTDVSETIKLGTSTYTPHDWLSVYNNSIVGMSADYLLIAHKMYEFWADSSANDWYTFYQGFAAACAAAGKTPSTATLIQYLKGGNSFPVSTRPYDGGVGDPSTQPGWVDSDGDGIPDSQDPTPNGEDPTSEPTSQPSDSTSEPWDGEPSSRPCEVETNEPDLKEGLKKLDYIDKLKMIRNGGGGDFNFHFELKKFDIGNPSGGDSVWSWDWDGKPSGRPTGSSWSIDDLIGPLLFGIRTLLSLMLFYGFIRAIYRTLTRA